MDHIAQDSHFTLADTYSYQLLSEDHKILGQRRWAMPMDSVDRESGHQKTKVLYVTDIFMSWSGAGFVLGECGDSIRGIVMVTGAEVSSRQGIWCATGAPARWFQITSFNIAEVVHATNIMRQAISVFNNYVDQKRRFICIKPSNFTTVVSGVKFTFRPPSKNGTCAPFRPTCFLPPENEELIVRNSSTSRRGNNRLPRSCPETPHSRPSNHSSGLIRGNSSNLEQVQARQQLHPIVPRPLPRRPPSRLSSAPGMDPESISAALQGWNPFSGPSSSSRVPPVAVRRNDHRCLDVNTCLMEGCIQGTDSDESYPSSPLFPIIRQKDPFSPRKSALSFAHHDRPSTGGRGPRGSRSPIEPHHIPSTSRAHLNANSETFVGSSASVNYSTPVEDVWPLIDVPVAPRRQAGSGIHYSNSEISFDDVPGPSGLDRGQSSSGHRRQVTILFLFVFRFCCPFSQWLILVVSSTRVIMRMIECRFSLALVLSLVPWLDLLQEKTVLPQGPN